MDISENDILKCLSEIKEPESGKDIISLKSVNSVNVSDGKISFNLVLPTKNPFAKSIIKACEKKIKERYGDNILVEINNVNTIETKKVSVGRTDDESVLKGVKNILAVASGKGGVGKSTVSVNLAVALAKTGAKVGLLDADVYGPSVPKMLGVEDAKPHVKKENGKDVIIPIEKHGIKMLSIGFFVQPEQALIWRGAMATSALQQFIKDTDWGELDYFLIDLPPGTGDIHLTMVQTIPVTASVIVSTPQQVAVADAIRGVSMFKADKIEVPVIGFIENMSWFTPAELPDNKYYIFGKGGVENLAEELDIPVLGQIPIVQAICEAGDTGNPLALDEQTIVGKAFKDLAEKVEQRIEERNRNLSPTLKVEIDPDAGCST